MSILVKIQSKGQVTLPISLRSQAGISEGDLVEAVFHRGKIVLTPKVVIDSSKFPTADDQFPPPHRRLPPPLPPGSPEHPNPPPLPPP